MWLSNADRNYGRCGVLEWCVWGRFVGECGWGVRDLRCCSLQSLIHGWGWGRILGIGLLRSLASCNGQWQIRFWRARLDRGGFEIGGNGGQWPFKIAAIWCYLVRWGEPRRTKVADAGGEMVRLVETATTPWFGAFGIPNGDWGGQAR